MKALLAALFAVIIGLTFAGSTYVGAPAAAAETKKGKGKKTKKKTEKKTKKNPEKKPKKKQKRPRRT